LQPLIFLPHTYVPLSCPQLCGISHTQLPAHCAAVWVPCALGRHCPVPESHAYIAAGVGGGVGAAAHVAPHCACVWLPAASRKQRPLAASQLNIGAGVGGGVGGGGALRRVVGGGVGGGLQLSWHAEYDIVPAVLLPQCAGSCEQK
jgi:hypothetical protein